METDLASCALDPERRSTTRIVLRPGADGREECRFAVTCQASRGGWIVSSYGQLECSNSEQLQAQRNDAILACSALQPVPLSQWYDAAAYSRAHLRYRFGMAVRPHCTVPNWRFLQEEPLRFYSLMHHHGRIPLSRILINIGAGDASWDDPLRPILTSFSGAGAPWSGVYFDAIPENCKKASALLQVHGNIKLHCGYITPATAVDTICKELGEQMPSSACASSGQSRYDYKGGRIEVDAMNVDIDSYDCSVLREVLSVISPKLLVVETGSMIPPPIAVSAEFHPSFQAGERHNVSGESAIGGATTRNEQGFWNGCSLSAAVSLLWQFGLGLYRYAMLNAMFIRVDAADAAGLAGSNATGGSLSPYRRWQPADEFECWRRACGPHPWGNLMNLTAHGVHTHLLPHLWERISNRTPRHPLTVAVSMPPISTELPRPSDVEPAVAKREVSALCK